MLQKQEAPDTPPADSYDDYLESRRWEENKQDMGSSARETAEWCLELVSPAMLKQGKPQKQANRTAYLDGLRGFAAFIVYWHHHQLWPLRSVPTNRILENAYGFEGNKYFATLPFIRTFFSGGHFAVAVFFVVSGYVLSSKPLTLIHSGAFAELGDNLASALFRRWLRLHIPIIIVTFIYMTSWHALGIWTLSPEHKPTYRAEFWNWYAEFKNFSFAFRTGGEAWFTYDFPTWSIPVEFRGSIIVYTSLLAFSRATKNARLLCQVALIYYFLYIADGWFGGMFIAGSLLCELDLLARNDRLPLLLARFQKWKTPFYYSSLVIVAILSGVPSHVNDMKLLKEAPGWYYLSFLKPHAMWDQKWIYLFWAAVLLVAAIPRIWWLKAFFETSFNQYLGRISFSLYLIHGPILWTLGDRLYVAVGWYREAHEANIPSWVNIIPLSKAGPLGLEPCFWIPHLILLPFTLWLAEITTKLCDDPSLKFSRWLYSKIKASPRNSLELVG